MRVLRAIRWFILLAWPVSAFAAQSLQQSFATVPGIVWGLAVLQSTLGGACALMFRLFLQFEDPDKRLPGRLWAVVAAQMMCSWLAGSTMLFLGLHWEWAQFLLMAAVGVAGFMGARFIESVAQWLTSKFPDPK